MKNTLIVFQPLVCTVVACATAIAVAFIISSGIGRYDSADISRGIVDTRTGKIYAPEHEVDFVGNTYVKRKLNEVGK